MSKYRGQRQSGDHELVATSRTHTYTHTRMHAHKYTHIWQKSNNTTSLGETGYLLIAIIGHALGVMWFLDNMSPFTPASWSGLHQL